MPKRLLVALLALAAFSVSHTDAAASEFSFDCISNSAVDCSVLESQISVTIGLSATDPTKVDFLFTNTGASESSLTDIYFDDGPPQLLSPPPSISASSGVTFAASPLSKCSPENLSGGSPYGFTSAYCADSDAPTQPNGVNPGEWLLLSYTLADGASLAQVLNAITTGEFSIGIHVQGFSDGDSVAGIMNSQPVPEPGTILLLGSGAVAAALARRRRKTAA